MFSPNYHHFGGKRKSSSLPKGVQRLTGAHRPTPGNIQAVNCSSMQRAKDMYTGSAVLGTTRSPWRCFQQRMRGRPCSVRFKIAPQLLPYLSCLQIVNFIGLLKDIFTNVL